MGRKHSVNHNLPVGMRARKRQRKNKIVTYYFYETKQDGKRKEIPLGTDYILAVQQWARLEHSKIQAHERTTFNVVATRYIAEIIANAKTENTRKAKSNHMKVLQKFFDGAPLDEIAPKHIRQYLDWRRDTPASANNEMSTFRDMWNYARQWGYTDRANPCDGVKRYATNRRDNYIEHDLYQLVYEKANQEIKDLMDIAYLTGQRPIDIVNIHSNDIEQGCLNITQRKTKTRLRFEISGDLQEIINRRLPEKPDFLFKNKWGRKLGANVLGIWFLDLRKALIAEYPDLAEVLHNFQFRDLRAKSATDVFLDSDLQNAQAQLGHSSQAMTQTYVRKPKPRKPIQNKIAE